jgi:hypothetical protein
VAATTTTTRAATTTTRPTTTTTTAAPTTTGGAEDLVDAIASNLVVGEGPFDREAADCFARGAVDEIGAARLQELGAGDPGITNADIFSQMSESEMGTLADVALGCLDMHALFVQQFVAVGLTQEVAGCIADGVSGAPFIRDLVVAGMMGEEVDPMSDPEAVTLITDLVTQCMAG